MHFRCPKQEEHRDASFKINLLVTPYPIHFIDLYRTVTSISFTGIPAKESWIIIEDAVVELLNEIRARRGLHAAHDFVCRGCQAEPPLPYCFRCYNSS